MVGLPTVALCTGENPRSLDPVWENRTREYADVFRSTIGERPDCVVRKHDSSGLTVMNATGGVVTPGRLTSATATYTHKFNTSPAIIYGPRVAVPTAVSIAAPVVDPVPLFGFE